MNPKTRHLIGEAELRSMKRSARLINVSRGALVDELTQGGGFSACSRWLSEATPPDSECDRFDSRPEQITHPGRGASTANMPSTHSSLHYHLIFATKNREPIIADLWRNRLHDYLGGAVRGLGGSPQGVGGVSDHVHLLVALKPTHCLSDFMRELKKSSSIWIGETLPISQFRWQ